MVEDRERLTNIKNLLEGKEAVCSNENKQLEEYIF